jgi:hypothetical protein
VEVIEGDVIHMEEAAESAAAQSNVRARVEATTWIGNGDAEGGGQRTRSAQTLEMRCEASGGDNLTGDGKGDIRWWWWRRRRR